MTELNTVELLELKLILESSIADWIMAYEEVKDMGSQSYYTYQITKIRNIAKKLNIELDI